MKHEKALAFAIAAPNNPEVQGGAATWVGDWHNQMKSSMRLDVNGDDVRGEYTSVSAKGGQVTGQLKGFVHGDIISFVVLWPGGSMTAWTGQMVDDKTAPRIKTLWHLVTEIADVDEPTMLWLSTLAGADEFVR